MVQTAINGVPDSDQAATNAEMGVIAEKFKAAGASLVIAVGDAGVGEPEALQNNQSTYLPRLIVPDQPDFETVVSSKVSTPAPARGHVGRWRCPAASGGMERSGDEALRCHCPGGRTEGSYQQFHHCVSVHAGDLARPETACQQMTLLEDIVKAAGKSLNNPTSTEVGSP